MHSTVTAKETDTFRDGLQSTMQSQTSLLLNPKLNALTSPQLPTARHPHSPTARTAETKTPGKQEPPSYPHPSLPNLQFQVVVMEQ